MDSQINERKSNFELARIVSAVFIILHHLAIHSNFTISNITPVFNQLYWYFIGMFGKVGVNIFVLISGYFLINSTFKVSKAFKIYLTVFLYSIAITFLLYILEQGDLTISSLFPISFRIWWFATSYFVLYLFTPVINLAINRMSQKCFKRVLIVLLIVFSVIPTIIVGIINIIPSEMKMLYRTLWLIIVYGIGAYISKYGLKIEKISPISLMFLALGFSFVNYLLTILIIIGIIKANNFGYFCDMNIVTTVIISVLLFLYFKNIKIRQSKIINTLALTTFGIYLIHDHYLLRNVIWNILFKNELKINSPYFVIISILEVIVVFFGCSFIELIRLKFIEPLYMKHLNKKESSI